LPFRAFDLVATVLILPFALILASLIALAVMADSPGPVLYRCRRVGYRGEVFEMVKFRKMRRDAVGSELTAYEDERFTPIGKFLSITRLDELPQLWNVLKGDMRLVGPRPEIEEFVAHYPREYEEILSVRPGLTGMAQLEFFDESRVFGDAHSHPRFYSEGILPHKIELDLDYVRHRSLRADFAIFIRTPLLPLRVAARKLVAVVAAQPRGPLVTYAGIALCALLLLVTFSTQA
jgi:lipopolysaccharide/colanic/teichoic acid biosynthesis glycosyltransferase